MKIKLNIPLKIFKKVGKIQIGTQQQTTSTSPPISKQTIEELSLKTPEALIKSLSDKDPFVRAISCEVLGRMR